MPFCPQVVRSPDSSVEPSEISAFSAQPTADPSITAIRSSCIENLCFHLFSGDSDSYPVLELLVIKLQQHCYSRQPGSYNRVV